MAKIWIRRRDTRLPDHNWQIEIFKDHELKGPPAVVILTPDQHTRLMAWRKSGTPIQDAFPELSDEDCRKLTFGPSD
jgi:hypothetical protein